MELSNNEKKFDRIISLCESKDQMDRIEGRIEWSKFSEEFTRDELNEMWDNIRSSDKV